MIFEIGFNHCCRNLVSNQAADMDNVTIKFTCNLLNEVTGLTETCLIEFFGLWARTLSFIGPGMDLKIVCQLPVEGEKTPWNDSVLVTNIAGPERVETQYTLTRVIVVETNEDQPNRYIEFDKKAKIAECKTIGGSVEFPNFWMDHKRRYVDKSPLMFRPLTTITADVPVINAAVAFISNSPPGPYKFTHPTAPYVKTHVQVCDLSFRKLRLAAIRTGIDDVPMYHLHLQIDENIEPNVLPWLCIGDVLQVNTVKPVFGQKQTWNLLHKQKNFGETKIKIWPIETEDERVVDIRGMRITDKIDIPKDVEDLRCWIRERLLKDTLLSDLHKGSLSGRNEWFSGRDLVARVEKINRHTNSIFITDFSIGQEDPIEVRIRSNQQNFVDSLNYLFDNIERHNPRFHNLYVLMRNLRVHSNDNALYCCVEHVTRIPEFCKDVQDLTRRREGLEAGESSGVTQSIELRADAQARPSGTPPTQVPSQDGNFSFSQFIPTQWRDSLGMHARPNDGAPATQGGLIDSCSQVAFEFVDDDEENNENRSPGAVHRAGEDPQEKKVRLT